MTFFLSACAARRVSVGRWVVSGALLLAFVLGAVSSVDAQGRRARLSSDLTARLCAVMPARSTSSSTGGPSCSTSWAGGAACR